MKAFRGLLKVGFSTLLGLYAFPAATKTPINLHRYQFNGSFELPSKHVDEQRDILLHGTFWSSLVPAPFNELSGTYFVSAYSDAPSFDKSQISQRTLMPINFYGFNFAYCMALSSKAFFGLHSTFRITENSQEFHRGRIREENNLLNLLMKKLAVDYGFQLGNEHLYLELHSKLTVEKVGSQSNADIFNQTLLYDFELPHPRYYLHFNPYRFLKDFFGDLLSQLQSFLTAHTHPAVRIILLGAFKGSSFCFRGEGENLRERFPNVIYKLNVCVYPKLLRWIFPIALNLKGTRLLPSAMGCACTYSPTPKELRRQILADLKAPCFPKGMLRFQS